MIKPTKDNRDFTIMSDCESVHVLSTTTLTKSDHIIVQDIQYKDENRPVNQVVSPNFTISMKSNSSISIRFNCTQWGEWKTHKNDGTCRILEMRPSHNSKNTTGLLKYKHNKTCSKFLFSQH